jgi:hypothetical protein
LVIHLTPIHPIPIPIQMLAETLKQFSNVWTAYCTNDSLFVLVSLDAAAFHKRVSVAGSIATLEPKPVMLLLKLVKMPDSSGSVDSERSARVSYHLRKFKQHYLTIN